MATEKATSQKVEEDPTTLILESFVVPPSSASVLIALILLLTPPVNANDPHPKMVQVFITPSMDPPLLMSLLDIPPFSWPMDMSNTTVVSAVDFPSSSSSSTSYVGIMHPSMKRKLEDNLTLNGGQKKGSPSSGEGFALACTILVTKAAPTSPEFVTISFDEIDGGYRVPPSSPT